MEAELGEPSGSLLVEPLEPRSAVWLPHQPLEDNVGRGVGKRVGRRVGKDVGLLVEKAVGSAVGNPVGS